MLQQLLFRPIRPAPHQTAAAPLPSDPAAYSAQKAAGLLSERCLRLLAQAPSHAGFTLWCTLLASAQTPLAAGVGVLPQRTGEKALGSALVLTGRRGERVACRLPRPTAAQLSALFAWITWHREVEGVQSSDPAVLLGQVLGLDDLVTIWPGPGRRFSPDTAARLAAAAAALADELPASGKQAQRWLRQLATLLGVLHLADPAPAADSSKAPETAAQPPAAGPAALAAAQAGSLPPKPDVRVLQAATLPGNFAPAVAALPKPLREAKPLQRLALNLGAAAVPTANPQLAQAPAPAPAAGAKAGTAAGENAETGTAAASEALNATSKSKKAKSKIDWPALLPAAGADSALRSKWQAALQRTNKSWPTLPQLGGWILAWAEAEMAGEQLNAALLAQIAFGTCQARAKEFGFEAELASAWRRLLVPEAAAAGEVSGPAAAATRATKLRATKACNTAWLLHEQLQQELLRPLLTSACRGLLGSPPPESIPALQVATKLWAQLASEPDPLADLGQPERTMLGQWLQLLAADSAPTSAGPPPSRAAQAARAACRLAARCALVDGMPELEQAAARADEGAGKPAAQAFVEAALLAAPATALGAARALRLATAALRSMAPADAAALLQKYSVRGGDAVTLPVLACLASQPSLLAAFSARDAFWQRVTTNHLQAIPLADAWAAWAHLAASSASLSRAHFGTFVPALVWHCTQTSQVTKLGQVLALIFSASSHVAWAADDQEAFVSKHIDLICGAIGRLQLGSAPSDLLQALRVWSECLGDLLAYLFTADSVLIAAPAAAKLHASLCKAQCLLPLALAKQPPGAQPELAGSYEAAHRGLVLSATELLLAGPASEARQRLAKAMRNAALRQQMWRALSFCTMPPDRLGHAPPGVQPCEPRSNYAALLAGPSAQANNAGPQMARCLEWPRTTILLEASPALCQLALQDLRKAVANLTTACSCNSPQPPTPQALALALLNFRSVLLPIARLLARRSMYAPWQPNEPAMYMLRRLLGEVPQAAKAGVARTILSFSKDPEASVCGHSFDFFVWAWASSCLGDGEADAATRDDILLVPHARRIRAGAGMRPCAAPLPCALQASHEASQLGQLADLTARRTFEAATASAAGEAAGNGDKAAPTHLPWRNIGRELLTKSRDDLDRSLAADDGLHSSWRLIEAFAFATLDLVAANAAAELASFQVCRLLRPRGVDEHPLGLTQRHQACLGAAFLRAIALPKLGAPTANFAMGRLRDMWSDAAEGPLRAEILTYFAGVTGRAPKPVEVQSHALLQLHAWHHLLTTTHNETFEEDVMRLLAAGSSGEFCFGERLQQDGYAMACVLAEHSRLALVDALMARHEQPSRKGQHFLAEWQKIVARAHQISDSGLEFWTPPRNLLLS